MAHLAHIATILAAAAIAGGPAGCTTSGVSGDGTSAGPVSCDELTKVPEVERPDKPCDVDNASCVGLHCRNGRWNEFAGQAPPDAGPCFGAAAGLGCYPSQEGRSCASACPDPCGSCGVLTCTHGVWESGGNMPPSVGCTDQDDGIACELAHPGDPCAKPYDSCLPSSCACVSSCTRLQCQDGRWTSEVVSVDIDPEKCFKSDGGADAGVTDGGPADGGPADGGF